MPRFAWKEDINIAYINKREPLECRKHPNAFPILLQGWLTLVYAILKRLIIMYSMLPLHIFSVRFSE